MLAKGGRRKVWSGETEKGFRELVSSGKKNQTKRLTVEVKGKLKKHLASGTRGVKLGKKKRERGGGRTSKWEEGPSGGRGFPCNRETNEYTWVN